jgi:uncharacterized damage-inducible protein DinB
VSTGLRALILRRLSEHPGEIQSLTEGLPPDLLKERPGEGRWSLHEIAIHLVETQEVFSERIARMLVEDRPAITPFFPDEPRREGFYLTRDCTEGMTVLRRQRELLLTLLGSLTDDQWRREGQHPDIRHYSVERCMESFMRHEEHHLHTMFNLFFGIRE